MCSITRWLKARKSTLSRYGGSPPPCEGSIPQGGDSSQGGFGCSPQSGDRALEQPKGSAWKPATVIPQCGNAAVQRAAETLRALELTWIQAADAPHSGPQRPYRRTPRDLAFQFMRGLQCHTVLVGMTIHRGWIQRCYEDFCEAQGVTWPPPYKDFARELASLMPRFRKEEWHEGERLRTATWYLVPEPTTEVAELAQEPRKSA